MLALAGPPNAAGRPTSEGPRVYAISSRGVACGFRKLAESTVTSTSAPSLVTKRYLQVYAVWDVFFVVSYETTVSTVEIRRQSYPFAGLLAVFKVPKASHTSRIVSRTMNCCDRYGCSAYSQCVPTVSGNMILGCAGILGSVSY